MRGHYNISSSIIDVDLLSSSDESSSDDADIMNDVTQPHLSTTSLTDSSPHLTPSGFLLYPRNFFHPTTGANPSTAKDAACHTAGKGQSLVWLTQCLQMVEQC